MNISTWFFHLWWVRMIKRQADSPHVVKTETEGLSNSCVLEIQNDTRKQWVSLEGIGYKLGIKSIQNFSVRVHRDSFKKELKGPDPVFSANQIAKIKAKYFLLLPIMIFFALTEAFLYLLTSAIFVADANSTIQTAVAVMFSIGIMCFIWFGLGKHFKYREAKDRYEKKEISANHLGSYRHWRNIGWGLVACGILAASFSAVMRIYILESPDTNGMTEAEIAITHKASLWGSLLTLVFTIAMSFLTAIIKLQFTRVQILYSTYRQWHRGHVRRNRYTQELLRCIRHIEFVIEIKLKKWLQLVVDMKRILKMPTEHDLKYTSLNEDYVSLKGQKGFVLNEDVYRKFSPLQGAHEELFEFGVRNDKGIQDKLRAIRELRAVIEEHLAEHRERTAKNNDLPQFSSNGKVKDPSIFNHA